MSLFGNSKSKKTKKKQKKTIQNKKSNINKYNKNLNEYGISIEAIKPHQFPLVDQVYVSLP